MIKIITKNGVEIPYLKETLSLKYINDAFSDSLNLNATEFPFIIEENEDVIRELGSSEINSLTTKKEIDITFIFGTKVYFGKLKVLQYLTNRRSCVLKFGNELITILDKKIADFMPVYKYNGEIPFTETVADWYNQNEFVELIEADIKKPYPKIDYAAPTLSVGKFYKDDEWLLFQEQFNKKLGKISLNERTAITAGFAYTIKNINSFVPMPYLLSLLRNPILNNGFKIEGNFVDNPFNQKIVFVPKNLDNNTAWLVNKGFEYNADNLENLPFTKFGIGTHKVSFVVTGIPKPSGVQNAFCFIERFDGGTSYETYIREDITEFNNNNLGEFSASVTFEVTSETLNTSRLLVIYAHPQGSEAQSQQIIIKPNQEEANLHLVHPTVNLKRLAPDWSIGETINNLKNWQNLNVTFDETKKTIRIDYNEEFLGNTDFVDLSKEVVKVTGKSNSFQSSHNLSYANGKNNVILEDNNQVLNGIVTSEVVDIKNKFKIIAENSFNNPTSKEYLEQEGITLLLLNNENEFTENFNAQTLQLFGENGIANRYWRNWINFRQKAKKIKAIAYLNTVTLSKIEKLNKIYFDNRMYAVKDFTTKVKAKLNEIVFELENIVPSIGTGIVTPDLAPEIIISSYAFQENTGGFFGITLPWKIVVNYNYKDIFTFDGLITAKQLIGAIGTSYTGLEYTKAVNRVNGIENFVFPYDVSGLSGIYEVVLTDNGIVSNIGYAEILEESIATEKVIITDLDPLNPVIYRAPVIFTLSFEDMAPTSAEIILQKIDVNTQSPQGLPIILPITNVYLPQYQVKFPVSGSWNVSVKANGITSNLISKWVTV